MRVVHACKVKGLAGAERHLLHLLPALAARGVDVHVIVLEDPAFPTDTFRAPLVVRGISVETMRTSCHIDPGLIGRLDRRLRAIAPDIVHTHLVHADLYGLAAARRAGINAAVSSRHDNNPFRRGLVIRRLNARAMRHARRIITISHALARFVVDVEGAEACRVATIHYGLPVERCSPLARHDARSVLGVPDEVPVVAVVGRLIEQKGVDLLIDAFPGVRARHAACRLVVIGDGPLASRLRAQVERMGLGRAVTFAGWIETVSAVLPACDVVVMPSRWEGLGLAALEAMASGRPVVASDVDALPEIVRHDETGLLVRPEDPTALTAAINGLLDGPDRAAALGEAGRRRVAEHFTVEKMTTATLDLYQHVLREAAASTR